MMERYLYISHCPKGSLKDCKAYGDLEEVRKERGVGCSPEIISMTKVARWTSPDGSGCYVIDFSSTFMDMIDTTHASHCTPLLKQAFRQMRLESIGI